GTHSHHSGAAVQILSGTVLTPVKNHRKENFHPPQIKENKQLSGIRSAVERAIAHFKNWKSSPADIVAL
ncbi:MAG: hypothetical protein JO287_14580, partial [Pseudonocardiales bacterium]|nr:hypothetical protein [Pseudonocardiales bacterium]